MSHAQFLWICLGPNQTFFARLRDTYRYKLSRAITSVIEKGKVDGEITAVALGSDETYVIIYGDKCRWDLKGCYGKLDIQLKNASSAPSVCSPESSESRHSMINLI